MVISESTATNEREQRQQSKTNGFNGAANVFGTPTVAESDGNFGRRFTGSAQLTSDRRFQDRLAVTVVDVMPNGNLVVEGYRSRVVAGEERVLRITGVVRVQDIGAGNVVQSTSLANAQASYLGRGPESPAGEPELPRPADEPPVAVLIVYPLRRDRGGSGAICQCSHSVAAKITDGSSGGSHAPRCSHSPLLACSPCPAFAQVRDQGHHRGVRRGATSSSGSGWWSGWTAPAAAARSPSRWPWTCCSGWA